MNRRFCLFYAGFTASAPSLYYYQLSFIHSNLELTTSNSNSSPLDTFYRNIYEYDNENRAMIVTAQSLAGHLNLQLSSIDMRQEEYFNWRDRYQEAISEQYPSTKIEHYYFCYAQKIAETLTNIGLIQTYITVGVKLGESEKYLNEIKNCFNNIEKSIFNMTASSALLSNEPQHLYFREFYNELKAHFEKIKRKQIADVPLYDLQQMNADLENMRCFVWDGFKRCIGILKKLNTPT